MKSELRFSFDDTIEDEMAFNRVVNSELSHRVIWDILGICRRYINDKNPDGWDKTAEDEIAKLVRDEYPNFEGSYS